MIEPYVEIMVPAKFGSLPARARRWYCRACKNERHTLVHKGSTSRCPPAGQPMTAREILREFGLPALQLTDRDRLSEPWNGTSTLCDLPVIRCGLCGASTVISPIAGWRIGYERGLWDLRNAMISTTDEERVAAIRRFRLDVLPLLPLDFFQATEAATLLAQRVIAGEQEDWRL